MRHAYPVTIALLIINLAVFVAGEVNQTYGLTNMFTDYLALSRKGLSSGFIWQLVTFQFLHVGFVHFIFNMLMLFLFGRSVEESIGSKHMGLLYVSSGVVGGLLEITLGLIKDKVFHLPLQAFGTPVVGSSASVLALLGAFTTLDPNRELLLFFILPVRAKFLFWFSALVATFYILVPAQPNVAHGAHLGGLMAGAGYIRWIVQSPVAFQIPTIFRKRRGPRRSRKQTVRESVAHDDDDELPPEEFISREVDPILEKISAHGLHSLTARERRILEAARAKMEKR